MQFKGKYKFLFNMYPCLIGVDSKLGTDNFKCVESAYHAYKNPNRYGEFIRLNGYDAKALSKLIKVREDWEDTKHLIMLDLLCRKFTQRHLSLMLKRTFNLELIEENNWGDFYWGVCNGQGENKLGKIIMGIRDTLPIYVNKTVCFTGSKPKDLRGYDRNLYINDKQLMKDYILNLYKEGYREFITGGSQGIEQLVLECLVDLKDSLSDIIVTVFLPYKVYGSQFNFGDYFSYNWLLSLIEKVDNISVTNFITDKSEVFHSIIHNNEAMVNCSDLLVTIYKNLDNITDRCTKYANSLNKPVNSILLK